VVVVVVVVVSFWVIHRSSIPFWVMLERWITQTLYPKKPEIFRVFSFRVTPTPWSDTLIRHRDPGDTVHPGDGKQGIHAKSNKNRSCCFFFYYIVSSNRWNGHKLIIIILHYIPTFFIHK
jgi:hypothetical protein